MTGLAQHVVRPERARADRIAGSAVAEYFLSAQILQQGFGADDAVAKLAVGHGGQAFVAKTMAGDLMTGGANVAYQRRESLGHPAKYEEGRVHATISKEIKYASGILFDPNRPLRPIFAPDAVFEGGDLEVVFDVHRHGIDDGGV